MSSDSYRLESFRLWNPFQDKAQSLSSSLDICRYPSPVSITATSPPSNSSNSASKGSNVHSHKSERHPLPPRPPAEVCMNDSLAQEIKTQHQPTSEEDQIPYVAPGVEAFDLKDILHLQDLPCSGDEDQPMIYKNPRQVSQHPLGFDPDDLGLACTTSQHSLAGNTESSSLNSDRYDITIDPAILDDHCFRDLEPTQARNEVSDAVVLPRSSDTPVGGCSIRSNSQVARKPARQRPKIRKVSVVVDNHRTNRTGRRTQTNRTVKRPFSVLRDQFSSLPVEDRVLFLSWLFEGALSQCLDTLSSVDGALAKGSFSEEGETSPPPPAAPYADANVVDIEHPGSSRKGLRFSAEEDRLLVKLRKEGLPWSEVIKRFSRRFPGRSEGSIQVHWSKKLGHKPRCF